MSEHKRIRNTKGVFLILGLCAAALWITGYVYFRSEQQVREAEEAARKVDISECKITVKGQTYTGKKLKPDLTVKYGKATLTAGTDYTVTYPSGMKNAGTYKVKVKVTAAGNANYKKATKTVTLKVKVA